MKIILASILMFSIGIIRNIYTYGYGVNDAFWRVVWAIDEGTIWAKNFDEENFKKVRLGMEKEEVLSLIGEPLDKTRKCPIDCSWIYTKQDTGTSDYDQRVVSFDNSGFVSEIVKSFYID